MTCVTAVTFTMQNNDSVIRSILEKNILGMHHSLYFHLILLFLPGKSGFPFFFCSLFWSRLSIHTTRASSRFIHITSINVGIANLCRAVACTAEAKPRRNALLLLPALSSLVQRREVLIHTVDVFRYVTLNSHNLAR